MKLAFKITKTFIILTIFLLSLHTMQNVESNAQEPPPKDVYNCLDFSRQNGSRNISTEELSTSLENHKQWLSKITTLENDFKKNKISYDVYEEAERALMNDPTRANLCFVHFSQNHAPIMNNYSLKHALLNNTRWENMSVPIIEFDEAVINNAIFLETQFSNPSFASAKLRNARLLNSKFLSANFEFAKLSNAVIINTDLSNAKFLAAEVNGLIFEPSTLPDISSFASAYNIETIRYHRAPSAIIKTRKELMDLGFRQAERRVTYALEQKKQQERLSYNEHFEYFLNHILFDLTTKFGLEPMRAIKVLIWLIVCFSLPYTIVILKKDGAGIWKIWPKERIPNANATDQPQRVHHTNIRAVFVAIQFSLHSAFNIGWRDFNLGNWISKMNTADYALGASGWIRTLSGLQSVISVFLFAIWALTYFGRPFE